MHSDILSLADRLTEKFKDEASKQHYLGSNNNLSDYRRPDYFSGIGPVDLRLFYFRVTNFWDFQDASRSIALGDINKTD